MGKFKEKLEDLGDDIKKAADDVADKAEEAEAVVAEKARDLEEKVKDSKIREDIDRDYNETVARIDLAADDIRDKF